MKRADHATVVRLAALIAPVTDKLQLRTLQESRQLLADSRIDVSGICDDTLRTILRGLDVQIARHSANGHRTDRIRVVAQLLRKLARQRWGADVPQDLIDDLTAIACGKLPPRRS